MKKVTLGPETYVYPKPTFLVGSKVDNNPNFMAVAWSGIVNSEPPMISVSIRPQRFTLKGIKEHGTFSVNIPSENQMVETDYCGIYSGHREDKNRVCGFSVFYGKLETAPLIEENVQYKITTNVLEALGIPFTEEDILEMFSENTTCSRSSSS